jgi:hypothetical protein
MPRQNRNSPLPDAARPQVADSQIQRALDTLATPLIEVIKFLTPFRQPEKWKPLPFDATWRNYTGATDRQRAAYKKDPLGRVYLRGLVERFSGAGTSVAILPVGYWPKNETMFTVYTNTGVGRLDVQAVGNLFAVAGGTGFISLDGISFDTES